MAPSPGHMFNIGLYSEKREKKIFWSETIWPSLVIWYVASHGGPPTSLFKLCPWGQKWPHPGVTYFTRLGVNDFEKVITYNFIGNGSIKLQLQLHGAFGQGN